MRRTVLVIILIITCILFGILLSHVDINAVETEEETIDKPNEKEVLAIQRADTFIKDLFKGSEDVLLSVTGEVKRNLINNIDELTNYNLIDVSSKIEYFSDKFVTINTMAEYELVNDDIDVIFYKFFLINENNDYLIYKLEQNFSFDNTDVVIGRVKEALAEDRSMLLVIEKYIDGIQYGDMGVASKHLVGKAKENHNLSYSFIANAKDKIEFHIKDIGHEIIVNDLGNISIVKTSYKNNYRDVSILTTLYNTSRGWMIYDIQQL